jgi:hypothetical protein
MVAAKVTPGCRRIIRRGRLQEWEPINVAEVDADSLVTDQGERIRFADIADIMMEWRPPFDGARQCWMPHDDEARSWFAKPGWDIDDWWIECGHWFTDDAALAAHQAECHSVFIANTERQRSQARLNPGPVGEVEIIAGYGGPGSARKASPAPATEKQLAYIASLAARKGVEANKVTTRAEASAEIERLQALPDAEPFRRNKYDSPCSECGQIVPAGEGVLRKDECSGRWLVGHVSCPDEPNLPVDVPDGYYAVTAEEGHTSFYRVAKGRKPGIVFVDLLLGGGPAGSFQRQPVPWRVRDAVLREIVESGIEVAALRFRQEAGRCARCGRGLTNKVSRDEMLGPECRKKV